MRRVSFLGAVVVTAGLMLGTGGAYAQRGVAHPQRVAVKKVKVPKNACKLLTDAQVKTLIPDAVAGQPTHQSVSGAKESDCYWGSAATAGSLKVTVLSLPSSIPTSIIKLSLKSEKSAKKVSGIGDGAIVQSLVKVDTEVKALFGRVSLSVDYNALGASTKQKAVIKLARAVAKKL